MWDIEALLGRQGLDGLDLEALEMAVRRQALGLAALAVQQRLNADHSDGQQAQRPCLCGGSARYAGRRAQTFHSILGVLELERAYYHCPACGHGFCPRDQQLDLQDTSLSPAVTRMIGTVVAMVSFEEGSQLLQELANVAVNAKQVERAAEALGGEIAADEKQNLEGIDNQPLPHTLYLGIDGTGIPMRTSELKDRSGKEPDGSAKTREVKLCTVWSAESRDAAHRPVRDKGSVTYTAAIESAATLDTDAVPSAFTQRVLREATRRRFTEAAQTVVLGDGAPLDLENRTRTVPARHPDCRPLSRQTASQPFRQKLSMGPLRNRPNSGLNAVTQNLTAAAYPTSYAPSAAMPTTLRKPNARSTFAITGIPCAIPNFTSKVSALPPELWKPEIIALRCCKLSGRFQDFWERRSQLRKTA